MIHKPGAMCIGLFIFNGFYQEENIMMDIINELVSVIVRLVIAGAGTALWPMVSPI